MARDRPSFLRLFFTSILVVALAATKAHLERRLNGDRTLVYFILIFLSFIGLSLIEVILENFQRSDWVERIFNKKDYIRGYWMNYAMDDTTEEIYNFAFLKIDSNDGRISINGWTFRVCRREQLSATIYDVVPDGHFFSTMSQYQSDQGLLGFNYTVDQSEKVRTCGHKIFGFAEYFFERAKELPTTFTGEFSTDQPSVFCHVIGQRIDEDSVISEQSLQEKYRKTFDLALRRKWIKPSQVSKCPQAL